MKLGGFICRLWAPGITATGVATGSTKHTNRNVPEDRVGGKCYKVKDNDVPDGSNQIRDVGRGAQLMQYREGSKLQGAAEEKNAVPGLWSGDEGGLHDISLPLNAHNRSRD